MQEATPDWRNLARALIIAEGGSGADSAALRRAADRVFGKLSQHMERLVGSAGWTALLRRALHLAMGEFEFLSLVQVGPNADARIQGLEESLRDVSTEQAFAGLVTLLSRVIWLLASFIGDDLVVHLVYEVWPGLPPTEASIG